MSLTATKVRQIKPKDKDYKVFDGKGLYLLVKNNGSKYWRYKYRFLKKEKTLSLGVYPEVSLREAREEADEARRMLRKEKKDPSKARKLEKLAQLSDAEAAFSSVALEWIEKQAAWSEGHTKRVIRALEKDVFPFIGGSPISSIAPQEILVLLQKIESRDALDVASRALQKISSIFRYAVQTGRATANPAAELKGVLKTRRVEHVPSIPPSELPGLLREIDRYDGHIVTKFALQLLMLTFVRPGELRGARWDEVSIKNQEWRIPAQRMKMNTEHIVPLSQQSLKILELLRPITGTREILFQGERKANQPISENTMTYAIYRMGYKSRATPHGFRATASSILNEEGFQPDAIERQLSHTERNQVRSAYTHHARFLEERRKMMQWWANYLDQLKEQQ